MRVSKSFLISGLLALNLGVGSSRALAHDDGPLAIFTMVYMASHMGVMGTYMGLISSAVASGTHDYVHTMNAEKRREADLQIDSRYHSDAEILHASRQADDKIKENKEMMKLAKGNQALQKECKKNISLWTRMKERGQQIEARQTSRHAGLSI